MAKNGRIWKNRTPPRSRTQNRGFWHFFSDMEPVQNFGKTPKSAKNRPFWTPGAGFWGVPKIAKNEHFLSVFTFATLIITLLWTFTLQWINVVDCINAGFVHTNHFWSWHGPKEAIFSSPLRNGPSTDLYQACGKSYFHVILSDRLFKFLLMRVANSRLVGLFLDSF